MANRGLDPFSDGSLIDSFTFTNPDNTATLSNEQGDNTFGGNLADVVTTSTNPLSYNEHSNCYFVSSSATSKLVGNVDATVCGWYYHGDTADNWSEVTFGGQGTSGNFGIGASTSSGALTLRVFVNGSGYGLGAGLGFGWNFIAGVYNSTTGDISFYINDTYVGNGNNPITFDNTKTVDWYDQNLFSRFTDLQLYNRQLTATELEDIRLDNFASAIENIALPPSILLPTYVNAPKLPYSPHFRNLNPFLDNSLIKSYAFTINSTGVATNESEQLNTDTIGALSDISTANPVPHNFQAISGNHYSVDNQPFSGSTQDATFVTRLFNDTSDDTDWEVGAWLGERYITGALGLRIIHAVGTTSRIQFTIDNTYYDIADAIDGWSTLTVTVDNVADTINFYINGSSYGYGYAKVVTFDNTKKVHVYNTRSGFNVSDIQIYNRLLTLSEVNQIHIDDFQRDIINYADSLLINCNQDVVSIIGDSNYLDTSILLPITSLIVPQIVYEISQYLPIQINIPITRQGVTSSVDSIFIQSIALYSSTTYTPPTILINLQVNEALTIQGVTSFPTPIALSVSANLQTVITTYIVFPIAVTFESIVNTPNVLYDFLISTTTLDLIATPNLVNINIRGICYPESLLINTRLLHLINTPIVADINVLTIHNDYYREVSFVDSNLLPITITNGWINIECLVDSILLPINYSGDGWVNDIVFSESTFLAQNINITKISTQPVLDGGFPIISIFVNDIFIPQSIIEVNILSISLMSTTPSYIGARHVVNVANTLSLLLQPFCFEYIGAYVISTESYTANAEPITCIQSPILSIIANDINIALIKPTIIDVTMQILGLVNYISIESSLLLLLDVVDPNFSGQIQSSGGSVSTVNVVNAQAIPLPISIYQINDIKNSYIYPQTLVLNIYKYIDYLFETVHPNTIAVPINITSSVAQAYNDKRVTRIGGVSLDTALYYDRNEQVNNMILETVESVNGSSVYYVAPLKKYTRAYTISSRNGIMVSKTIIEQLITIIGVDEIEIIYSDGSFDVVKFDLINKPLLIENVFDGSDMYYIDLRILV